MTRVHFVKKARKKNPVAKKGESYYWWQFAFSAKQYSKEKPRRSQLTRSEFYSQLWDLQDEISDVKSVSDLEELQALREDWVSRINEIADECEEKLNNMPDSLRDADSGQLLQERADGMRSWADELESVDLDFDMEEYVVEELEQNTTEESDEEPEEDSDEEADREDEKTEIIESKLGELLSELQSTDCGL